MVYNDDNASMNLQAVMDGIKNFGIYSKKLEEFDKATKGALNQLGQTHKDQNFVKFTEHFVQFWKKEPEFKVEVDNFIKYLEVEKKQIEEYIAHGNTLK